jgi:transketolase C-terminal domain/subunit
LGPVAIVATGSILKVALQVADLCEQRGHSIAVYSMPWIHPLSQELLGKLVRFKRILALEEHVSMGGLASSLREHLPASITVETASWPSEMVNKVGSQDYLRAQAGLCVDVLLPRILSKLS